MNKDVRSSLILAGGMIAVALGATVAHKLGYIDKDMVLRLSVGINGLMIVYYGNRAPKAVAPGACARRINRVTGWSMVLSGLVYAGLWAFAPIYVATIGGTGAVLAGVLVTFGYCVWLRRRARVEAQRA